jgi:hypothetical protein
MMDAHRAQSPVELETPPEAVAEKVVVDLYLLRLETGHFADHGLRYSGDLGANPDLARVLAHVNRAVHRLHGRVRQERLLIDGFHHGN